MAATLGSGRLFWCASFAAFTALWAPALGGTTGSLTVRVVNGTTGAPIAGAPVTARSPSQASSGATDAKGIFRFLSLAPDTYTVEVAKVGYATERQAGITIFADQERSATFTLHRANEIAYVRSRPDSELVRAGTTSDVYSVDAQGTRATRALGGSGSLAQAYAAISGVPGVVVPAGQQGWYQNVYIHGGDFDQVAYEFDGVPVIRESDGAPIVTLSTLGQQEVQVYTGATSALSNSPGLAGYINQVVKTGTSPGYGLATLGAGTPAFYHEATVEAGGATPDRLFSYYVGIAGSNQEYRYGSQFDGAGDPLYFYPEVIPSNNSTYHILDGSCTGLTTACSAPDYGATFGPGASWTQSSNAERDTIANLHFGIPHHNGGARDDVQVLFVTSEIFTNYFSSADELGLTKPLSYLDGVVYDGPLMAQPNPADIVANPFPFSPAGRSARSPIDPAQPDGASNGASIVKFQYQRTINANSYVRAIAYGEYSDWYLNGPNGAQQTFGASLADYEVNASIRGATVLYASALSNRHLLSASLSYSTQALRTYDATYDTVFTPMGSQPNTGQFGSIVANFIGPNGDCYNYRTGEQWSCFDPASVGTPQNGLEPAPEYSCTGAAPRPAACNLSSPPQWKVTENGENAQVDAVTPRFSSMAVTDVYTPSDRLTVNAGVRLDRFAYGRNDLEAGYPARAFWFQAYNNQFCGAPGLPDVSRWSGSFATGSGSFAPCPAGYTPVDYTDSSGNGVAYTVVQPRLAFTYAMNPDTIVRGSIGRYARPSPTSYEQYNTYQQDLPSFLSQFAPLGYRTPDHDVRPDTSDNLDLSYEHRFPHAAISFKVTPFYRTTHNQIEYVNISALGGTVAGVNVGSLQASGIEFAVKAGDFAHDGISAQLSYTHTGTKTRYASLPSGLNVIDLLNRYIQQYNSYTQTCAPAGPTVGGMPTYTAQQQRLCGSNANASNGEPSFVEHDQSGNSIVVANPYYARSAQPLLNDEASYAPYDTIPGPFSSANSYAVPDIATLVVNFKRKTWAVTPSLSYSSGASYGSPLVWPGYVPQACSPPAGASPNPPMTPGVYCGSGGALFLPDPYTGRFDALGSLKQPSQLTLNLQYSLELPAHSAVTIVATGLYNRCFQRGYPWDDPNSCAYSSLPSNILAPVGNFIAPLASAPVELRYPYATWFNNTETGMTSVRQPFTLTAEYSIQL